MRFLDLTGCGDVFADFVPTIHSTTVLSFRILLFTRHLLKPSEWCDQLRQPCHQSLAASRTQVNPITDDRGVRMLAEELIDGRFETRRFIDHLLELHASCTNQQIGVVHVSEKRLGINTSHLWNISERMAWLAGVGNGRVESVNACRCQSETVAAGRELSALGVVKLQNEKDGA